jgi:hypothetical protein
MEMSSVTSKDDVPEWVITALVAEVQKVQCDACFSYGAEVVLASRATFGAKSWTATEASFSLSFARALQSSARGMARDVKAWLVAPTPPVGKLAAQSPGS